MSINPYYIVLLSVLINILFFLSIALLIEKVPKYEYSKMTTAPFWNFFDPKHRIHNSTMPKVEKTDDRMINSRMTYKTSL